MSSVFGVFLVVYLIVFLFSVLGVLVLEGVLVVLGVPPPR
jgi:hypothetical protein